MPFARQRCVNSSHRRLLPTPASPTIPITCGCPAVRLLAGALEHRHLLVAADEPREAARPRDVEAPARGADAGQLVDAQRPARRP